MGDVVNLLHDTLKVMKNRGYEPEDVAWVGTRDAEYALSWDDFALLARRVNHYGGYHGPHIDTRLVVVFADGNWMERGEYDGSEFWEHRTRLGSPVKSRSFRFSDGRGDSEAYREIVPVEEDA